MKCFNFPKVIRSKIRSILIAVTKEVVQPELNICRIGILDVASLKEVDVAPKKAPLHVMHLITSLNVGGAQMDLYKAIVRFNPERISSTVVSLVPPGKIGKLIENRGIPVLSLGMHPGRPNPMALFRLAGILRRFKPHILQTYLYHADLLGYLAGKLSKVPLVLWNLKQSSMDFSRYRRASGLTVWLCARLSRRVKNILVNSLSGLKAHALLGYDAERMVMAPNGFEMSHFRPDPASYREVRDELGIPPNSRLVGILARFDPQKDHETFLKAAGTFTVAHPEVYVLMAGSGVSQNNLAFSDLLKATQVAPERLLLLGERSDMPRLLASLDVFVSSSAFGEGMPTVVGEAMACGVPCVVTDVGDSALMVGETGLVVPPQEPGEMARAVGEALTWSPAERTRRSKAARTRIQENFDITKIAAQLESFYLNLVAQSASQRMVESC